MATVVNTFVAQFLAFSLNEKTPEVLFFAGSVRDDTLEMEGKTRKNSTINRNMKVSIE